MARWLAAACLLAASPCAAADAALIAAAKAEKEVVWYTTQAVADIVAPLAKAFEAKYGIKVSYTRNTATQLVLKVINEAKANRREVDVIDGTFSVSALKKEGVTLKWTPDTAKDFPKDVIDPEGYWTATNVYVATPAINTDLIKPADEPKTLADLANPKWKGRIVWSVVPGIATGAGFVAAVIKQEGEAKARAFFAELAKQNVVGVGFPARTVLDQIVTGEYSIMLQNFNSQAVVVAAKGAPVKWLPISPATLALTAASVVKDAPHPNAARLLVDFLVSPEGQTIFRDLDYVPASPAVPPKDPGVRPDGRTLRAQAFTPEEIDAEMPKWTEIFNEYFR